MAIIGFAMPPLSGPENVNIFFSIIRIAKARRPRNGWIA
jgi:hypothetical protein